MSEAMREAFEKWIFKERGIAAENFRHKGGYLSNKVGLAWSAYQAALSGAQQGVAESAIDEALESGGWWASCSGCHETNEGVSDWPRSIFGCHAGSGCHECGGIGVIWHEAPTDEQLAFLAADPDTAPPPAQVPGEVDKLRDISVMVANGQCGPDVDRHIHDVIAMLTAAPSGDAKREAEIKAEALESMANKIERECPIPSHDAGVGECLDMIRQKIARLRTAGDEGMR